MKKILFVLCLILASSVYGQRYEDYYGSGLGRHSDSLQIAVNDSLTGEYIIYEQAILIQVDSNWTASNIGVMVYNPYEEVYELLQDEDGTLLEYTITQGRTTTLVPVDLAGAKKVKFKKMTSGSGVAQSGSASTLIVHSIRY